MPAPRTEPYGCLRVAIEYLKAAEKVQPPARSEIDEFRQRLSFPAYFLAGHAIELALKAFLLGRGMSVDVLRSKKYGHDLRALLTEARRRRLGLLVKLSPRDVAAVLVLNECYSAKELEYAVTGIRRLPHYSAAIHVADALISGLGPYCRQLASGV